MNFDNGEYVVIISKLKEKWKVNKAIYEILDNNINSDGKIKVAVAPTAYVYKGEKRSLKHLNNIFKIAEKDKAEEECSRRNKELQ